MSVTIEGSTISPHSNDSVKNNGVVGKNDKIRSAQHKLFSSIAIQEGFTEYEIDTVLIPSAGGNYLGILYKVNIQGKKLKKSDELRLFVKVAADNEALRKLMPLHEVYCNEIYAYKVLSRIYNQLQIDANVPEEEMFMFTKFYGSIETNLGETIVLDNLSYKNYKVHDRFKSITLEYAKVAVDKLAKFHALSYVLQRRDPVYFDEVIKTKKGNLYLDKGGPQRMQEYSSKIVSKALMNLQNSEYSDRLEKFCQDMCENISKYVKVNKYPVLCHGDYRGNNLLVKYEKEMIKSLIPIDYQLIHYGSPLNDLIYFIFGATDSEFRKLHLDYIQEFYYDRLGDFLNYFSLDVTDVYPKEDFDADVKSHRTLGLVLGVHMLQFLLISEDAAPDLEDLDESAFDKMSKSPNAVYMQRYNDIIEDFVKWGYL